LVGKKKDLAFKIWRKHAQFNRRHRKGYEGSKGKGVGFRMNLKGEGQARSIPFLKGPATGPVKASRWLEAYRGGMGKESCGKEKPPAVNMKNKDQQSESREKGRP